MRPRPSRSWFATVPFLALGGIVAAGLLLASVARGQERMPVEHEPTANAYLVRDIDTGRQNDYAMTPPERVGDVLVSWIKAIGPRRDVYPNYFLCGINTATRQVSLLEEISPASGWVAFGGRLYFSAYTPSEVGSVTHIWSTDGTTNGTRPLVGSGGERFTYPTGPMLFNGKLYFFASAGDPPFPWWGPFDMKLWQSDGTADGTVAIEGVTGINPSFVGFEGSIGGGNASPPPTAFGGSLVFFALSSRHPSRPWGLYRMDAASTAIIFLGDFSSEPQPILWTGSIGYFVQQDMFGIGGHGRELWRTDGTPEGTYILRDICPGECDSYLTSLTVVGDTLYFMAFNSLSLSNQVWKSDGTAVGTTLLAQIRIGYGSPYTSFVGANGQVLFTADDGVHGEELWRTDGTAEGTRLVMDVRPGPDGSGIGNLVVLGPWLLFTADDGVHGQELWRSDGTAEGTRLVMDVRPGSDGSGIENRVVLGPWLLFTADDGVHGQEMWRSDGTAAGTLLVADIAPGSTPSAIGRLVAFRDRVYFSADDSVGDRGLWQTDGTPGGTRRAGTGSNPFLLPTLSSLFVLAVDSGGLELWEITDTTSRPAHVARIDSGSQGLSSNPYLLTDVGGRICFFTPSLTLGGISKLWTSDGTGGGTRFLYEFQPRTTGSPYGDGNLAPISVGTSLYLAGARENYVLSSFYRFDLDTNLLRPLTDTTPLARAVIDQTAYFTLNQELWKTSAVSDDPVLVKRFTGSLQLLTVSGRTLYISERGPSSSDPGASASLWRSDGTETGTVPIWSGWAKRMAVAEGLLFFTSDDGFSQGLLWVIPDASSAASPVATRIGSFPADRIWGHPLTDLTVSGRMLFFLATDPQTQLQRLWRSDGTAAGTFPLSAAVDSGSLRANGSGVYFVAPDEKSGRELWKTDGTPQGTVLVKDINPGPAGSNPRALAVIDGTLLFSADDGLHGRELWRSEGTTESTYLLQDICPGACSSDPAGFTKSASLIYFSATTREAGNELWAMPASAVDSFRGPRPLFIRDTEDRRENGFRF